MKPIDNMKKPLVIGIIGGPGTGKTYFSEMLVNRMKAYFIEGDAVGHSTLNKPEVIQAVSHRFGNDVISPEGIVDRKVLGGKVFGNEEALMDLNAIMHPKMYRAIEDMINETDNVVIVLEAAVMIEAGFDNMVDIMFCLRADYEVRMKRLTEERHIPFQKAEKMIASGRVDNFDYGDYIIDTTLGIEAFQEEIDRICTELTVLTASM